MGDWHLAKGEYGLAVEAYKFPLERFKEWGWLRQAALVRHGMALAYERNGDLDAARECLRQAIATFKRVKYTPGFDSQDLESARRDLARIES